MVFEDIVNKETRFVTKVLADPCLRNANISKKIYYFIIITGDYFQFERRGYFRVDKINTVNNDRVIEVIYIPDGKQSSMTKNLT